MAKQRVLFVCVHNSARSQMAEAFLKQLAGDRFEVESAGIEPGALNPIVVDAMKEIGIDISGNQTKDVFDFLKRGKAFSYVITVCDEASGERCPIFPGISKRMHWSFEDPSSFTGTYGEKLRRVREVRNVIRLRIKQFLKETSDPSLEGRT
ncbi:MAG TPA: arsenate reductase ArsC [Bacteroidota bacterium]|nr:arsenate reductase ArsC [Bacteroidota bacterium]